MGCLAALVFVMAVPMTLAALGTRSFFLLGLAGAMWAAGCGLYRLAEERNPGRPPGSPWP